VNVRVKLADESLKISMLNIGNRQNWWRGGSSLSKSHLTLHNSASRPILPAVNQWCPSPSHCTWERIPFDQL